jgi:hypothetical protein
LCQRGDDCPLLIYLKLDFEEEKMASALEAKGVEIYSCGVCLEFYGVTDKLKVGKIGNAFGTIEMLFGGEGTISL